MSRTLRGLICGGLIGSLTLAFGADKKNLSPQVDVDAVKAQSSTSNRIPNMPQIGPNDPFVKPLSAEKLKYALEPEEPTKAGPRGCVNCTDTENEPDCGIPTDTVNGGCNSSPPVFSSITCGQTVCGTGGSNTAIRDTDWWLITLPSPHIVTWTVTAEFATVQIGMTRMPCPQGTLFVFATGPSCTPVQTVSACLPAGDYVCFVAPFTASQPCGLQYTATVTCTPCEPPPAPENDTCETAELVTCGSTVIRTNEGATDDGIFPLCSFGGAPTNSDVWFKFVATENAAVIDTCGGGGISDTVLSVYDGCNGAEIGCNDDACGLLSAVTVIGLTPGNTYYIRVAGWNTTEPGQFALTVNCQHIEPAANDTCETAIEVQCGSSNLYSNIGATDDGLFPSCSFGGAPTNSDVWFKVTLPAGNNALTADVCGGGSMSDTVIAVYDACNGSQVACNDDFCGLLSRVTALGLTPGNTYYIRVAGWNVEPQGTFTLTVDCASIQTPENDNCSTAAPLQCNSTITVSNLGATDDGLPVPCSFGGAPTNSDLWWSFVASSNNATVETCGTVLSVDDTVISVYSQCGGSVIGCNDDACGLLSRVNLTGLTIGNTYLIRVAGWNLEPQGEYNLTLTCPEPTGACCLPTGCQILSGTACANQGGTFEGPGTNCGGLVYSLQTCDTPLEDISSTGTLSTVTGTDDGAQLNVPIGFSFPYFGTNRTAITISGNGFLTFDPSVTGGFFSNGPVPGPAAPNDMIAPLWDDLDSRAQGQVRYQTLSSPQRFIVQWTNMQHFPTTGGPYTFQAILYATGDIEFRYGFINNGDGVYSPSIGMENGTGTEGIAIDPVSIGSGPACRHIAATVVPNPCGATGACCLPNGDCAVLTEAACAAQNGQFNPGEPTCGGEVNYGPVANCEEALEDISGTGTLSTVTGTDDGAQLNVPIGFPFPYFGTNRTSITISGNGFLTFDPSVTGGFFSNGPVPGTAAPNSMIAPLWDDLDSRAQGQVHYQTLSSPQRFIVQWTNIQHFPTSGGPYTFQAILYANGNIAFRYGSLNISDGLYSPSIGIEDATGTQGVSITPASIGAGNACRSIPMNISGGVCEDQGCDQPGGTGNFCSADINGDCEIGLGDLTALLSSFGLSLGHPNYNPNADFNGNNQIDISDLTFLLSQFGDICHL